LNVAFIQSQRNEPETAMSTYRQILSREPGNKLASAALQQLTASQPELRPRQPTSETADLASSARGLAPVKQPGRYVDLPSPKEDIPPRPTLIVSADEVPPSANVFEAPIITPDNGDWGSSQAVARSANPTKVVSAQGEFELPRSAVPPAELAADAIPVQQPAAAAPQGATSDDVANAFADGDNLPEAPRQEMDELTGLEWARSELAEKQAAAPETKDTTRSDDCLRGFCPVALRDERRLAPVSDEFTTEYQAQNYRFSSAAARDRFLEHPDWYVPVAGGLDIIEVKRGHELSQGSLDFAVWFRHRLHMFSNAENLAAFRSAPRDFVSNP